MISKKFSTVERIHSSLEKFLAKGWELVDQTLTSITLCKGEQTMKLVIVKNSRYN